MNRTSLESWLWLRAIDGVGDATLLKLVQRWKTPEAVCAATIDELIEGGCSLQLAAAIHKGPDTVTRRRIDQEWTAIERHRVRMLSVLDRDYPVRLKMIPDPPPLLYVAGTLTDEDGLAVAIVGARKASPSGRLVTEELSHDLAAAGVTIVSGLARGVDAAAHRGALSANGRTIAVLGCGIDRTYPPEHDRLRKQIEEHGAVLSEVPMGTPPHSHHFPRRNRIISGLCLGVIVTEAAMNSGSLITAKLAGEQGREVFAVPGHIKSETSRGSNGLLKDGAGLVEQAQDVLDVLRPQLEPELRAKLHDVVPLKKTIDHLGKDEAIVYDALSYLPSSVDIVIEQTGLQASVVVTALLSLELQQRVRQLPGQRYLKT
ncbi:MAG TPA: DNA-processing protein DprA [Nitrospiraceae bacterium]